MLHAMPRTWLTPLKIQSLETICTVTTRSHTACPTQSEVLLIYLILHHTIQCYIQWKVYELNHCSNTERAFRKFQDTLLPVHCNVLQNITQLQCKNNSMSQGMIDNGICINTETQGPIFYSWLLQNYTTYWSSNFSLKHYLNISSGTLTFIEWNLMLTFF